MKYLTILSGLLAFSNPAYSAETQRPNIVYLLVDDLGWSDCGFMGCQDILPQALREAGYATAICGKWHLGEYQADYTPTNPGFDQQYGHMFGAIDYFTHTRDGKEDWYRNDKLAAEEGYSTQLIAKEACRIISDKPDDKPLFLYVPFNGVHAPLQVPDSYKEPYRSLPEPRRSIAGMLAAVDEAIGQIKDALTAKGISDNTLIL